MEKERLTEELGSEEVNQQESTSQAEADVVLNDETAPIVEEQASDLISTTKENGISKPDLVEDVDSVIEASESENGASIINTNTEEPEISEGENERPESSLIEQDIPHAEGTESEDANIEPKASEGDIKNQDTQEDAQPKEIVDEHVEHEEQVIDYSAYSRDQLLEAISELAGSDGVASGQVLKSIRSRFDELQNEIQNLAQEKFIADGGEKEGFQYQPDELNQKFNVNYNLVREKRHKHFKNLEYQKADNLKSKNLILEELRELVDGEETVTSLKVIKQIQERWKKIGPIPKQHNRTLWANYHALMDRFYDHRSIHFELKDLDRKKNLELKIELCEKVEALAIIDDLPKAIHELNLIHEEFKHVGPVPQENQEETWLRFKAASDSIYSKRRVFVGEIKEKLQENLSVKLQLCDEMESYAQFSSDQISEWNDHTKKIQGLQKKWETIGGLPRDKSKVINKRFWSSFKTFFANKGKFFKSLEGQREDNLKLKEAIIEKAESLKDSSDLNKTAEIFKGLQNEWRNIGPVPEKVKNVIFKKFKSTCDEFFNRKRAAISESEKEYEVNLTRKQEICDQLEELSTKDKIDLDIVEALQTQFGNIGFVPRNSMKKMTQRYEYVLKLLTEKIEESDLQNKDQLSVEIQIRKMKSQPGSNKSMQKQETNLRKQITTIENNISTWKNNLEFFRASKTADKLKKEFDVKIDAADLELKQLKKQLRMIKSA